MSRTIYFINKLAKLSSNFNGQQSLQKCKQLNSPPTPPFTWSNFLIQKRCVHLNTSHNTSLIKSKEKIVKIISSEKVHLSATMRFFSTSPQDLSNDGDKTHKTLGKIKGTLYLEFTCNKCEYRSEKTISKQAYKDGVVLIRCDGCESIHLIADNLGWFRDEKV